MLVNYYAVAELDGERGWSISFLEGGGIAAVAERAEQIVAQALSALASKVMSGGGLPRSIEQGERVPMDLISRHPGVIIVVIPFDPVAVKVLA